MQVILPDEQVKQIQLLLAELIEKEIEKSYTIAALKALF